MRIRKKSKPIKPWFQILLGVGLIIWGAGSLIYQMQPGVIGLKSIPIIILIAGLANTYIGIKRNQNPEDSQAKTKRYLPNFLTYLSYLKERFELGMRYENNYHIIILIISG